MNDKPHILIVEGRFYEDIADGLVKGAIAALDSAGVAYQRLEVPGALEIPTAIRYALRSMEFGAASQHYAGFVALGCVIRGETSHYDYVCGESTRALTDLALEHCIAIGNGILTVENRDQAWARADVAQKDKGGFAANACLRMMMIKKQFRLSPS